ncbi:uncharacterized protein LOC130992391 [Salvia miltiorrhiza]|uniref:uncharacterized protein LOC130992391 n=1 Tax=Salvia miltiorrhiza TaxID=226208 RepID=UPI0025AC73A2|nr:uncharacterized protein LOC130992391 [Salvia miltiorrhiza]
MEKVINHFCHEHPLFTCKQDEASLDCYVCGDVVSNLESAYACKQPQCNNSSNSRIILHERCGEMPSRIFSHPSHLEHPLHLFDYRHLSAGYFCNLCGATIGSKVGYRCPSCEFDIHIECCKLGVLIKERVEVQHPSHVHPLTLMRKNAFQFSCDGCGTQDMDMAYICSTCEYWVHATCASLPLLLPQHHHHHHLSLAFTFPMEHRKYRYMCDVCDKDFDMTCWLYFCGDCRYFAHLKCAATPTTNTPKQDHFLLGSSMATAEEVRALKEQLQRLIEAQENRDAQKQPPINEAFTPQYQYHEPPRVNANNFELKTGLITMVQQNQYGGKAVEDPNAHLAQFLELCSTVKINGVPDDIIRLRLFPFSLRDKAKSWYQTLQLGANPVWGDLADLFLRKFHPPGLTLKLKMDILQFQQFDGETLAETWERYQEKLRKCPSHGFDEGTLVVMFYNACGERAKMFMDTAAGGSLLKKGSSEAMEIIESMATTSYQWPSERVQLKKVAAASSSDPMVLILIQLAEMNSKINAMTVGNPEPAVEIPTGVEDANYINGRNYGNFQHGQQGGYNSGQQFHHGGRPHPNLAYGNSNNALQAPPGFSVTNGVINEEKKPNLEELLMKFICKSDERMEKLESNAVAVGTQMKMFETQLGQIATTVNKLQQSGNLINNAKVNAKEQCMAIRLKNEATSEGSHGSREMERGELSWRVHEKGRRLPPHLRPPGWMPFPQRHFKMVDLPSGTTQEGAMTAKDESAQLIEERAAEVTVEVSGRKNDEKQKATSPATVTTPLPQRQKKERGQEQFSKFLEIFRKVHINIPLVEALQEMPQYARFLKDIISRKRRLEEFETVNLNEECSAILQRKLPAKIKDPGSFTLFCIIGGQHFRRSLCDLGASINLMSLSVFKQLAIGELKPTSMRLQMADRSVTYPRGIVENVLVKVGDFILPTDFVVLDIEDDNKIPLILGRPFLGTGRALIDVEKGELTLRVHNESQTFYVYESCCIHKNEVPKRAKDPGKGRVDVLNTFDEDQFSWQDPGDQSSQEGSMAGKSGAGSSRSQHCLYQPP